MIGVRLGVDAGGSGSRAVVVRGHELVDRLVGGPLNVLLHPDAVDRLAHMITSTGAVEAGIGLAGITSPADARRIEAELASRTGARVAVANDGEAALMGAFAGAPGIVVIAGTGSIAFGRGADGVVFRAGGHGYLIGDDGSGYWIGNQAVRRALASADGTGPCAPALETLVRNHFGLVDIADVEAVVYAAPTDRPLLAGLVPGLANSGDPAAEALFTEAAGHLAALVDAIRQRVGPLPAAMIGGVWNVPALRSRFVELTGAVDPQQSPEWGALLLLDPPQPEENP